MNHAILICPTAEPPEYSLLFNVRKAPAHCNIEKNRNTSINLIYILAARPAAPGIPENQLVF
jgi:hypothetical protein